MIMAYFHPIAIDLSQAPGAPARMAGEARRGHDRGEQRPGGLETMAHKEEIALEVSSPVKGAVLTALLVLSS